MPTLKHAFDLIHAGLEELETILTGEPAPVKGRGTATPTSRPVPKAPATRTTVLPEPPTPAPNAQPELSAATRADSHPKALAIAKRIIAMLGPTHPQGLPGFKGQLAIERIATDDQLITSVWEEAKNSAGA